MGAKFVDVDKILREKNPGLARWIPGFVVRYLRRIVHQDDINEVMSKSGHLKDHDFCKMVIEYFNVKIETYGLENIPQKGGTIFSCNHPLGGLDALALVKEVTPIRADIKFVVNDILLHLENLKGMFVGVNKHGSNTKESLQELNKLFASDQAIFVFPAGLVSRKIKGKVQDLPWQKTFVSRSRKYERDVVPVHIEGELSNWFYRLANFRKLTGIKANIEMLYLADEMFKLIGTTVKITFGRPISYTQFDRSQTDEQWAQWVKEKVYELKQS